MDNTLTLDLSKTCSHALRIRFSKPYAKIKASHAREIVAAYFGYKSHAALLQSNGHIAVDPQQALQRCSTLKDFPIELQQHVDIVAHIGQTMRQALR